MLKYLLLFFLLFPITANAKDCYSGVDKLTNMRYEICIFENPDIECVRTKEGFFWNDWYCRPILISK